MAESQRATTWEEFRDLRERMHSPESEAHWGAFAPRPTDVIISPYAKSGTTWLQQIVHGLRTRGDMDFDDISRVIPWIETALDLGLDLDADQRGEPRAFKSHLSAHRVPPGARYIVSLRDPKDAFVSFYRFMEGWWFEAGTIDMETVAHRVYFLRERATDYWTHLLSWWPRRDDPDVLLLSFEGMRADLEGVVIRVAQFIGVPLDQALLDLVVGQSSFEFMRAHGDRFDDALIRRLTEERAGLPPGGDSSKVREGAVGSHRAELSAALSAEMDAIWSDVIEPELGFATYAELAAALP